MNTYCNKLKNYTTIFSHLILSIIFNSADKHRYF